MLDTDCPIALRRAQISFCPRSPHAPPNVTSLGFPYTVSAHLADQRTDCPVDPNSFYYWGPAGGGGGWTLLSNPNVGESATATTTGRILKKGGPGSQTAESPGRSGGLPASPGWERPPLPAGPWDPRPSLQLLFHTAATPGVNMDSCRRCF